MVVRRNEPCPCRPLGRIAARSRQSRVAVVVEVLFVVMALKADTIALCSPVSERVAISVRVPAGFSIETVRKKDIYAGRLLIRVDRVDKTRLRVTITNLDEEEAAVDMQSDPKNPDGCGIKVVPGQLSPERPMKLQMSDCEDIGKSQLNYSFPPTTRLVGGSGVCILPRCYEFRLAEAAAGSVPDGGMISGEPLRIKKETNGRLALSWGSSCKQEDDDYEIYAGVLGQFASHRPVECTTYGTTSRVIEACTGNCYYLVVPRSLNREGSYGVDSKLNERGQGEATCLLQYLDQCGRGPSAVTLGKSSRSVQTESTIMTP